MQFLYPAFLWALTALSIPIILHLFYFRRYKKIYFSNLRFLREVKEETSARNRLRNLLILLSRLLAMAFIILAFTQPIIPLNDSLKAGIRNVSVFVDNSFSMQSFGKDLSLFDRARQKANEVIMGYGPEDRFQVLGHELSPSQNLWISRDEALVRLEEMEYTPAVKPLSVIVGRQKQSFAREEGVPASWLISDFQQSIYDLSSTDTNETINLLPLIGVQEKNVAIDSAWFESPVQTLNQNAALLFSIHNYAAEDADNIRVVIDLDGQERPLGTLDIKAGAINIDTSMITVLKTGWHNLAIRISDFPVTFDDTYFLTFYVEENLHVLSINERNPNDRISAVFSDADYFILDQSASNNITYSRFPEYNLIILNELTSIPSGLNASLKKYTEEGGKVLFIPSSSGNIEQYNTLMRSMSASELLPWNQKERQVGKINTESFIYNDVFNRTRPNMRLPKVSGSFPYAGSGSKGQSLLGFRDGGDLISFYTPGKGGFCVITSPLDEKVNDLVLQPEVFVPLLFKLTIYAADFKNLAYTIGTDHLITLDRNELDLDKEVMITGPSEFIPGISLLGAKVLLDVQGQIKTSGFYTLLQDNKLVASLAFNYDRKESDLTLKNVAEITPDQGLKVWSESEETDFTHLIASSRQGKPLWRWCIILGLIFIGFEIALIRLWKA
jgi:Aerotolerance regulator N-terminal